MEVGNRPARRSALARLAAGVALTAAWLRAPGAVAQGTRLAPTPRDAEGPFYPRSLPADVDNDLMRVAGRSGSAQGIPLYLSGTVVDVEGRPLAGAVLELWQCDAHGSYHHVGHGGGQDTGFQGYGRTQADAEGRYTFRAMRPVPYGGRPAHLHFKLAHPAAAPLTTQLYVRGESAERGWSGGFARERDRLEITLAPASGREASAVESAYRFVLAPARA
jgi:protocatechuate 3,4-dioxygenase beta subunit